MSINPNFVFVDAGGVPCPVLHSFVSISAGGSNVAIAGAVAGKRVRFLSVVAYSTAAANVGFRDGTGGSFVFGIDIPAPTASPPQTVMPFQEIGWMETTTGNGVFADSTVGATISVRYIVYTPVTA